MDSEKSRLAEENYTRKCSCPEHFFPLVYHEKSI